MPAMRPLVRRASDPNNRRVAAAMMPVFEYLSMVSLVSWRATSLDNYIEVNRHLRTSLHALLRRFVPDPVAFLQMISPWGAVIVGEAALSHILHEPALCKAALEIAVGNLHFDSFLANLTPFLTSGTQVTSSVVKTAPPGFPFHRHISRIAEYRLTSGLVVAVYESSTPSPCDVVCGYWTSAMMNFVTGYSFGCAYPRLTFNNLTLFCDTRTCFLAWWDFDLAKRMVAYGFQSGVRPSGWPLHARGPSTAPPPLVTGCGKSLYVCPFQGRYFGDRGSLVAFYDGFCVDLEEMRQLCIPPYGPMVTWRLPSRGLCAGICIRDDSTLPPFIASMVTQFMDVPNLTTPPPPLAAVLSGDTCSRSLSLIRSIPTGRRFSV